MLLREIKRVKDFLSKRSVRVYLSLALILGSGVFVGNYFKSEAGAAGGSLFANAVSLFKKTFSSENNSPDYEISLTENNSFTADNKNQEKGKKTAVKICSFETKTGFSQKEVIINEVAWMGTMEDGNNEWIELKNVSGKDFNLAGAQLLDKDGQIKVVFPESAKISTGGFYILERTEETVPAVKADILYSGNLKNSKERLRLFNSNCDLMDEAFAEPNWPAGENDKSAKKTMERNSADFSWHSSETSGGTPKKENSQVAAKPLNKETVKTETVSQVNETKNETEKEEILLPPVFYELSILKSGNGAGAVRSNPVGINCGADCRKNYESGTQIVLSAVPETGSVFQGWSGDCAGAGECSVVVNEAKSVTVSFGLISLPPPPPPPAPLKVEITEIMYDLPSSDAGREWIEILNGGSEPVDFTGWRFREANVNHILSVVRGSPVLAAGARAVIVIDSTKFLLDNVGYDGAIFDSSFSLSNTGETIGLKNGEDIIDEVTYSSSAGGSEDGNSLQKNGGAWIAVAPTPGR